MSEIEVYSFDINKIPTNYLPFVAIRTITAAVTFVTAPGGLNKKKQTKTKKIIGIKYLLKNLQNHKHISSILTIQMISVRLNCSYSMCSMPLVPPAMRVLLLPNPLRNLFRAKTSKCTTKQTAYTHRLQRACANMSGVKYICVQKLQSNLFASLTPLQQ